MVRGSWPLLVAAAAVFLVAFRWQRQRSTFLAIENEAAVMAPVAQRHGLAVAEAFAVRELVGGADWEAAVATFGRERQRLGDGLAAVALVGDRAAAEAALAAAPDPQTAWARFQTAPEALPGLRFLAMRERFAARAPARD